MYMYMYTYSFTNTYQDKHMWCEKDVRIQCMTQLHFSIQE